MLEVSEVGNKVGKADYKAAVPDLRVGLVNAQYDLRLADFPVVIWIAGDDRIAANQMVNRLNEWMDARFATTRVFAENTQEESERPQLWRLWRSLPAKGRSAIFVGGLMRAASMRVGRDDRRASSALVAPRRVDAGPSSSPTARWCSSSSCTPRRRSSARSCRPRRRTRRPGWFIDQRDWAALDEMSPVLPIAERILRETSGPGAPWTIVEATNDRYRDLTVGRTILAATVARLAQKANHGPVAGGFGVRRRRRRGHGAERRRPDPGPGQGDLPQGTGQGAGESCTGCRSRRAIAASARYWRSRAGTRRARAA